jgi:peptide/nickel transport system permease protein
MDHLLGTDRLGRDTLSRLIYGVGIALIVALPAVLSALVIGLLLGIVAAWRGGLIDALLVIVMDVLQAFPAVILALALLALLGPSLRNVIIVISIAFIPNYARVSRALVFSAKANQWVEAERALGASTVRIVFTHILPNILPPLLILMAMDIPSAIVIEAGLSFLGLGVQPPTPSWGAILADGFQNIMQSPWGVVFASIILMITTLGFTMLGETLRDIVDPRLSGLTRRRW